MSASVPERPEQPERPERHGNRGDATGSGFGRVLVAVYAILALSAVARGVTQLVTQGSQAPLAYGLSVAAGLVYVVATLALARAGRWRRVAWVACTVEAVGVLAVGVACQVDPSAFPDQTVWSGWGAGYGYIPLVLPFVGLAWLWRTRPDPAAPADTPATEDL